MLEFGENRVDPELKSIVAEASLALARLDADRLEELALSCQALNRRPVWDCDEHRELARQSKEAASGMAVFARVLEATRANLNVMNRLRELREGRLEYGRIVSPSSKIAEQPSWSSAEKAHGDN